MTTSIRIEALFLVGFALAIPSSAQSASFSLMDSGSVETGWLEVPTDVSDDGAVVVGYGYVPGSGGAIRWTEDGGVTSLGDLPGGRYPSESAAVSGDGRVVVGWGGSERAGNGVEAFRWTESGGLVGLGDLPGGASSFTPCVYCADFYSFATSASRDGSVVVGLATSDQGSEPFRWTEADGMVGLGNLPGADEYFATGCPSCLRQESRATDVSGDGSIVVGVAASASALQAFRWTEAEGMVGLGGFAGSPPHSWARAISADGSVVVGDAATTTASEAFRWTSTGGMVGLGDPPAGLFDGPREFIESSATDVSSDGSVVVGTLSWPGEPFDFDHYDTAGFVWTEHDGMQTVGFLLTNLGIDLGGWNPYSVDAISADGRTIVGSAYHRETDRTRIYVAVIPEPSSALLIALGLMGLAKRGRSSAASSRARCLTAR